MKFSQRSTRNEGWKINPILHLKIRAESQKIESAGSIGLPCLEPGRVVLGQGRDGGRGQGSACEDGRKMQQHWTSSLWLASHIWKAGMMHYALKFTDGRRPDKYWVLFLFQTSVCNSGSRCSFRRNYPSCQHLQIPLQFIWGLFGNQHLFPLNVYICCLQSLTRQVIAKICPYFSGLTHHRELRDLIVLPTSCNFRLQLRS